MRRLLDSAFAAVGLLLAAFLAFRLFGPHLPGRLVYDVLGYEAFGRAHDRALLAGLFVAAVFAASGSVVPFVLSRASLWQRLGALVVFGCALQWAVYAAENRGVTTMHDRIWNVGHTEFIRIAEAGPLPADLIEHYEEHIRDRGWVYPASKGPGTLYVYRALVDLAEGPVGRVLGGIYSDAPVASVDDRISAVFVVLFPLFTFLTVIPLFFVARALADEAVASLAALLFVFTPSALLVVMHLDGALYPLLGTTAAALVLAAPPRRRAVAASAAGVVLSFGCFVTISLLPVVAVVGLFVVWRALVTSGDRLPDRIRVATTLSAAFVAGFALPHLFWVVVDHYRVLVRLQSALAFHAAWWSGGERPWLTRYLNFIQFALWFGPALSCLCLGDFARLATTDERRSARAGWALACTACVVYSTFHAKGEVMRLWLFWMPLLAVFPAASLVRLRDEGWKRLVPLVLISQVAVTFAIQGRFDP